MTHTEYRVIHKDGAMSPIPRDTLSDAKRLRAAGAGIMPLSELIIQTRTFTEWEDYKLGPQPNR